MSMTAQYARPSEYLQQRIKSAKLPPRLYHYTTQAGCIGIFKSRHIWATNIRFLNDEKEFVLAHDLAFEYLQELVGTSRGEDEKAPFYFALKEEFQAVWDETYVASFSTAGDLLSQWRAYARNGYALGFNPQKLADLTTLGSVLGPCIYDEGHQRKLVQETIEAAGDYYVSLLRERLGESAVPKAVEECQSSLGLLAPLIKHHSFAEECEWRLIVSRVGWNNGLIRFRGGRSLITPYIEVPLSEGNGVLYLDEVVVGPTPHPSGAKTAAAMLQMSTGVGVEDFSSSEIPYRDW